MLTIELRMVDKHLAHSSMSFKHMSICCPYLDPCLTTHRLNIGIRLREVTKFRPYPFQPVAGLLESITQFIINLHVHHLQIRNPNLTWMPHRISKPFYSPPCFCQQNHWSSSHIIPTMKLERLKTTRGCPFQILSRLD